MSRRLIVKKDDIYRKRGEAWSSHYQNRNIVKEMCAYGLDGARISMVLQRFCVRELDIDGSFLSIPLDLRQGKEDSVLSECGLTPFQRDFLCDWYWTENGWLEFVRLYQALPEVEEDFYYLYESEPVDRFRLVPMSSKPKRGDVPNVVDKLVEKVGGTQVQVVPIRYK